MRGDFDKISGCRFEAPNGVLSVSRWDVVSHHHVLGHDVTTILDDVVEDRTTSRAKCIQPDCHWSFVQLQKLGGVGHIGFWNEWNSFETEGCIFRPAFGWCALQTFFAWKNVKEEEKIRHKKKFGLALFWWLRVLVLEKTHMFSRPEFKCLGYLVFKWHSNTRPFGIQPLFNHLYTEQVRYSDPHCTGYEP